MSTFSNVFGCTEGNISGMAMRHFCRISAYMRYSSIYQGCAGRSFFQRGGARIKIRGAGRGLISAGRSGAERGEKARKSTDLKIRQKCVNCYWRICITVWCFDQGKHYIL